MLRSIWEDIVYQFRQGSVTVRLISICVVVFLLFETLHLILWAGGNEALYTRLYYLFALPASLGVLATQPWSAFTFMFMHADVWHIFYNMLWLYWFGEIYQLYMRDRRALPIFICGSLAGGALIMALSYLLPPLHATIGYTYTVGASAGIFAIIFAATALNPDHGVNLLLIGRVPIKYIALASIVISYVTITHGNAGGIISHIGGAIFGFAYIRSLRAGVDWFTPLDRIAALFQPRSRLRATHVSGSSRTAEKKTASSNEEQKRVDAILDKIAKSGYNSLTKEEKDFLFKFSNK